MLCFIRRSRWLSFCQKQTLDVPVARSGYKTWGKTPNTTGSKLKKDKLNCLCCRVGFVDLGLSLLVECVIIFLCPYYIFLLSALYSQVETQPEIIFNRLRDKLSALICEAVNTQKKKQLANSHRSCICHISDWEQNNPEPPTVSFQSDQVQVTASCRSLGIEEDVGGRQTERQRMLTHSRTSGLLGKNSRHRSLQNVSSCFQIQAWKQQLFTKQSLSGGN